MNKVKKMLTCVLLSLAMIVSTLTVAPITANAGTSDFRTAFQELFTNLGYPNIVYLDETPRVALANFESITDVKMTSGNYIGILMTDKKPSSTELVISSGGKKITSGNYYSFSSDWSEQDGVCVLPFAISIPSNISGDVSVSFTFSDMTAYYLSIGGSNSSSSSGGGSSTPPVVTPEPEQEPEPEKPAVKCPSVSVKSVSHYNDYTNYSVYYVQMNKLPSDIKCVEWKLYTKDKKKVDEGTSYSDNFRIETKKSGVHYVQVRAYKYDEEYNKVYSGWSKKYFMTPPKLKSDNSSKSTTSINLKWSKVSGASKYIVYCSKNPNKGYKKVGTTTKTSFKVTKFNGKKLQLTKSNSYYFKVEAVGKASGKTYTSKTNVYLKWYRFL